ncbi:MAG: hypothetical protein O2897_04040 [bacterium]|nr:hypothetical protein [bacterium]
MSIKQLTILLAVILVLAMKCNCTIAGSDSSCINSLNNCESNCVGNDGISSASCVKNCLPGEECQNTYWTCHEQCSNSGGTAPVGCTANCIKQALGN